jgi:hypothetical protein
MLKICLQCHKEFNVKYDKRRKFCRPGCASIYNNKLRPLKKNKPIISYKCAYCTQAFDPGKDKDRKFCSRSCSSKSNHPRQKPKFATCTNCGGQTTYSSCGRARKFCDTCLKSKCQYMENLTIKEASYERKDANRYRKIRHHAHEVAKRSLGERKCSKCNYNKHVELAHINGISYFHENTKLSVVNAPSNLMWLCPNCHWEFDHPNPDCIISHEDIKN